MRYFINPYANSLVVSGADSGCLVYRHVQPKLPMRESPSGRKVFRVSGRCFWPSMPLRPEVPQDSWAKVPQSPFGQWYLLPRERTEVRTEGCLLPGDSEERREQDTPKR